MKDFRKFVLHNCILVFDAEQVYLKLQVTNLKNKKVTVNPKTPTLEKNWFFENPIPQTLNSKHQICPKPETLNPKPTPKISLTRSTAFCCTLKSREYSFWIQGPGCAHSDRERAVLGLCEATSLLFAPCFHPRPMYCIHMLAILMLTECVIWC